MGADAAEQAVNWWVLLGPVVVSAGGGSIVGGILVARYKERIDKRLATAQRERDRHLARADTLRRLIAALVAARSASSNARRTDLNKRSNLPEVAAHSRANHEIHTANFQRLADDALIEAERYGLIPEWSRLRDRHLSAYVNFVLQARLGLTLDAFSYQYGQSVDAHSQASALIEDLRALVDAEEAQAQDAFIDNKKRKTFQLPELPYLNALKPYFSCCCINVKNLDFSVLETRLAEIEDEERRSAKGQTTVIMENTSRLKG